MRSKELRAQRAKLVEDARELIAGDNPSEEANAKFDEMMAEADKLKAQIDRIEAADAAFAATQEALRAAGERRGVSADELTEQRETEKKVFAKWVKFGAASLKGEEAEMMARRAVTIENAMGIDVGSTGGFTVPDGFMQTIVDAQKAYGGMLDPGVSYQFTTASGNPLPIPTDNDVSNTGAIVGENTSMTDASDVAFGAVVLGAYMYSTKPVKVSLQLLQDSAFDIEAFLAGKMATRIARIVNTHLTVGDGASKPKGVVTASTVGKTGATGETTSLIFDDLIDLQHAVDPAYRRNARYMMADSTLKAIKKLKDGQGRYLWQPGLPIQGVPDMIEGFPYTINQDMPAMAASANSIAFGDFSNYYVRRVAGATMLRLTERYADVGQVGFLLFQRWDGNLVDAGMHPVQLFQNSAS